MGYELTKDITVEEISTSGFEGPDACPEESILTYGLVWKPTGEEDEYVFYFAIGYTEECIANRLDWGTLTKKELADMLDINGGQINTEAFFSFLGISIDDFDNWINNFPYCVQDVITWWGTENTFGSSYSGVKLIQDEDEC